MAERRWIADVDDAAVLIELEETPGLKHGELVSELGWSDERLQQCMNRLLAGAKVTMSPAGRFRLVDHG